MQAVKQRLIKFGAIALLLVVAQVVAAGAFSPYVDDSGHIHFPSGFRTSMVHLGSWFVPTGDASGFHDVYTEKETVDAFRKTGTFPDGATLVKELRVSEANNYTTGSGVSYATKGIKQWFVMIKDAKGRFADNPLWGDGWGWALYKYGDRDKNVATSYKTDCLGCHVPAKAKDLVYTEGYPTLSAE
ncbi:MAG: cytochrome P460 family protein [Porticoccaceae bacterium]|nr:cytochrome P460 family protein [Porticoccaceae bacterium]